MSFKSISQSVILNEDNARRAVQELESYDQCVLEVKSLAASLKAAERAISIQQQRLAVRDSTIRAYAELDTAHIEAKRLWALKQAEYQDEIKRQIRGKKTWGFFAVVIGLYAIVETFRD